MSDFDALERSEQDGAPVELYKFATAECATSYWTSAERDVVHDGHTWVSASIRRDRVEVSNEKVRNNLKLAVSRSFPIADLFRVQPPSDVISVSVYRYHRGDGDTTVLWLGRVLTCTWQGAEAELYCEPASTSLSRTGLRRLYQANCPHVLYGKACKVNKDVHAAEAVVMGIDGLKLHVDPIPDKPYSGGFVDWIPGQSSNSGAGSDGCRVERRFITNKFGNQFWLLYPFSGIAPGDVVVIYPGCDHTMAMCNSTYSNIENYGGMPFIPTKNPFAGTQVY